MGKDYQNIYYKDIKNDYRNINKFTKYQMTNQMTFFAHFITSFQAVTWRDWIFVITIYRIIFNQYQYRWPLLKNTGF